MIMELKGELLTVFYFFMVFAAFGKGELRDNRTGWHHLSFNSI